MDKDTLLSHLEGVRQNSAGWTARCPGHDDRNPSLAVSEGDGGRTLLHCHAGCTTEAIVAALGLEMRDLFTDGQPSTNGHVARSEPAQMPPIDPEVVGSLVMGLKKESRDYLQRERLLSPEVIQHYELGVQEKNGERRLSIPVKDDTGAVLDIRRWLSPSQRKEGRPKILHWQAGYGAPRLYPIDQLQHDHLVFCEGELDALALISHGIAAITLTAGATTPPTEEQAALFEGKTVILLMDHDEAGRQGAKERASRLAPFAQVKVAPWPEDRPEGWDVTDELKDHGIESLKCIVAAAVPMQPPQTLLTKPTKPSFVSSVSAQEGDSSPENWPEPQPLPDSLPAVEPFEFGLLPEAFRLWIEDVAERMQCPPDYLGVGAMVALGAVVGRQVAIHPRKQDDWLVVPNLWGAAIGPPSLMKSPALQEILSALHRLESRAREVHGQDLLQFEAAQVVAKAKRENAQSEMKKALKAGDDPKELALACVTSADSPPARQRYVVNDPTVEKLGEILSANPRGVLLFRDELVGFLKAMEKDGHETDRAFYLEAWDGKGRFTYDRIGRGTVEIEAACISILGGIQPGPLGAYVRSAAQGGGGADGLIQRFQLAVYPDISPAWQNHDRLPHLAARACYAL